MKFLKLLLFYIFIAFLGYTLRNAIDYYRSSGKYKNENDPTHFENVGISDTKYLDPSLWRISRDELA